MCVAAGADYLHAAIIVIIGSVNAANNYQPKTDNELAAARVCGRLVAIVGPTAVGKTALGIALGGERLVR